MSFWDRLKKPKEQSKEFSASNVQRLVDVDLASGRRAVNVPYGQIGSYIDQVQKGNEDFMILSSQDGYLQFYGVGDQFVAEMRINLSDGDFRTYSFISQDKAQQRERVQLITPYGQFTPTAAEVLSLELLRTIVQKYYEYADEEVFLSNVVYMDTTEQTKRYMGLIK